MVPLHHKEFIYLLKKVLGINFTNLTKSQNIVYSLNCEIYNVISIWHLFMSNV